MAGGPHSDNTVTGVVLRRSARSAAIDSIGASPDPPTIMKIGPWDSRTFSCPNGPDTRSRSPGASRSSRAAEKAPPGSTRTTRSMDPDSLGGLAIENARVAAVPGTSTVTDLITVKPPVSPEKVQAVIEDAFKREAEIDARHISVEVSDHTAKLYGHVHPLHEAAAARAAAAAAPWVATVESHLLVSP